MEIFLLLLSAAADATAGKSTAPFSLIAFAAA
jgi:hypothetical protein